MFKKVALFLAMVIAGSSVYGAYGSYPPYYDRQSEGSSWCTWITVAAIAGGVGYWLCAKPKQNSSKMNRFIELSQKGARRTHTETREMQRLQLELMKSGELKIAAKAA